MFDLSKLRGAPLKAKGHVRIDYKDPITGKVLERIEGDNHVFVNQFFATSFQTQNLAATLLLTDGQAALDTDLPWIPGKPIGYAEPNSAASGLFHGAYRASDSYINRITQNGVESLYVYDFLTSQIPDPIRYVGLTGAYRVGHGTTPFQYRWPRDNFAGIYDVERKRLLYNGTCSLSSAAGGDGTLYIDVLKNESGAAGQRINLFSLCDSPDNYWAVDEGQTEDTRGYFATWGYDYENQRIVLKLTRYFLEHWREYVSGSYRYYYTYKFRDDFWTISIDGSEVYQHFSYSWNAIENCYSGSSDWKGSSWQYYYHFWTGDYAPNYCRLYGDKLYGFSQLKEDYTRESSRVALYIYKYDITTGEITWSRYSGGDRWFVTEAASKLYCYKGYTWGQGYYGDTSEFQYQGTRVYTNWGVAVDFMGTIPMYDVYTDSVYTSCPVIENSRPYDDYYLIEKGQTNVYGNTWNLKPLITTNTFYPDNNRATMTLPFAYTAYKLPADAPVRPENSAVTIAYGLSITW